MALKRLRNEYKNILKNPNYFYSVRPNENNFLKWDFILLGPPDTIYEGGMFNGNITFPKNYPERPPQVKFTSELFHPNFYKDGRVCISILHEGEDQYGYEKSSERWNISLSFDSIMMSILSILAEHNLESPANMDSALMWRNEFNKFKTKVYKIIAKQQNKI